MLFPHVGVDLLDGAKDFGTRRTLEVRLSWFHLLSAARLTHLQVRVEAGQAG